VSSCSPSNNSERPAHDGPAALSPLPGAENIMRGAARAAYTEASQAAAAARVLSPAERELVSTVQNELQRITGHPHVLIGGKAVGMTLAVAGLESLARPTQDIDLMPIGSSDVDGVLTSQAIQRLYPAAQRLTAGHGCCILNVPSPHSAVKLSVQWARELFSDEEVHTVDGVRTLSATHLLVCKLSALVERSEAKDITDIALLLRSGADFGLAMSDMTQRSQSTAIDVLQVICSDLHTVVGDRDALPDGTSWDALVVEVRRQIPRGREHG